jgi:hypothetical protein
MEIGDQVRNVDRCAATRYLPHLCSGELTFIAPNESFNRHSLYSMKEEDCVGEIVAIHRWRLSGQPPCTNFVVDWGDKTQSILPSSSLVSAWTLL